ncbi:MAG: endonuclease/exonuclease/phosphatase family protein [Trueperaceae bacterium]|nr:endonuclease/exonuclease/phosphatase family protein [Trueperaceae bacterium]
MTALDSRDRDVGAPPVRPPFFVELLRFVLVGIGYLSLLPALAWYLAYIRLGDQIWWMFLVNSGATYLFAPVPIVLLAALLTRRWGLAVAALVPLIVGAMVFGQLLVPRSLKVQQVDPSAPRLSVMTFNVHAHNDAPDALVASILAAGADIVALQELSPSMTERVRNALRDEYPHFMIAAQVDSSGNGILSRYPFEQLTRAQGWSDTRSPHGVMVHLPWGDLVLFNNHNTSTSRSLGDWPTEIAESMRQRERVSESLVAFAAASPVPVIAVGDFNTTERSSAYDSMTQGFDDAWREAGFGFGHTFPGGPLAPTPFGFTPPPWLLRIDYVFFTRELTALDARIGPWDGTSDHRPVVAVLAWPN